jgi:hypothetical protein
MRPLSETLTDLIRFAEETITKPSKHYGFMVDQRFADVAAEVRHADALPAEGARTTRAGMVMVITLEEFFAGEREPTSHMLMLAGATLPWLRGEAWTAFRNEKEARRS